MRVVAIYEYAPLTAAGPGKLDEIAEATALNNGSLTILSCLRGPPRSRAAMRQIIRSACHWGRPAFVVQGEREQDLIRPDARHGSLVHRLRKDRRPLAGGQGSQ